jgi:hypothetical protein
LGNWEILVFEGTKKIKKIQKKKLFLREKLINNPTNRSLRFDEDEGRG